MPTAHFTFPGPDHSIAVDTDDAFVGPGPAPVILSIDDHTTGDSVKVRLHPTAAGRVSSALAATAVVVL